VPVAVLELVTVEERFAAPAKMLDAPDSTARASVKVTAAEVRKYPAAVVCTTGLSTRRLPDCRRTRALPTRVSQLLTVNVYEEPERV
jgi:hypothetical protein